MPSKLKPFTVDTGGCSAQERAPSAVRFWRGEARRFSPKEDLVADVLFKRYRMVLSLR